MTEKHIRPDLQSWTSLFQPDVLAPVRYYETLRRKRYSNPEKKLMYAVLEDAVACFQKHSWSASPFGKTHFREAEVWLLNPKNDGLYSFENICEVLDLNPAYIRAGLSRWRERARFERAGVAVFYAVRSGRKRLKPARPSESKMGDGRTHHHVTVSA